MTSWIDRLRPGSFRGFAFQVLDQESPVGREVAVHSFPLRTGSKGEDLGGVTPRHDIEVFLIGDDCLDQRDGFEALLARPGTGPLILPWSGEVTARLISGRVRYSDGEGGIVRYRLSFMEESDAPVVQADADTAALAVTSAEALHAAAQGQFAAAFSVAGQPQFVLDEATSIVRQMSDAFDGFVAPLKAGGETLNGWVAQALGLRQDVIDLVTKPADLASAISGLIQGVSTLAATPGDALTAFTLALGFGGDFDNVPATTPARQQQADNQSALTGLIRQSAAAEAVKQMAASDFASYPEAVAARDALADLMDDLALSAGDGGDTAWTAIEAARLAMIRDITARGASLARLRSYTPDADVPALVLAWRLYARDVEAMAADIVQRNGLLRPGFIPAGTVLEVLADA